MSISFSEIVVVFLVALLLFGPEQLPQIARQLGKITAELRKATNSVRREWYNTVYPPAQEIRREFEGEARQLRALRTDIMTPPSPPQTTSTAPQSVGLKPSAEATTPINTEVNTTIEEPR